MRTYTGGWIDADSGTPSLKDLSVQLSREARYAGATREFWPVSAHCLAGTSIAPAALKVHFMFHEPDELYFGDVPGPFKPENVKTQARVFRARFYNIHSLRPPTLEEEVEIHALDRAMAMAEMRTLFGPESRSRRIYTHAWREENLWAAADSAVKKVLPLVLRSDVLRAEGALARTFLRRAKALAAGATISLGDNSWLSMAGPERPERQMEDLS